MYCRNRSLSTVVGALISLIAIMAATAGVAYYISSLTSAELGAVRLTTERLNEWLRMYNDAWVSSAGSLVCFEENVTRIIASVVVIYKDKLLTFKAKAGRVCIPRHVLDESENIILVSEHGAMLPLPKKPLLSLEGSMSISALTSIARLTSSQEATALPASMLVATTFGSRNGWQSPAQLSLRVGNATLDGSLLHFRIVLNNSLTIEFAHIRLSSSPISSDIYSDYVHAYQFYYPSNPDLIFTLYAPTPGDYIEYSGVHQPTEYALYYEWYRSTFNALILNRWDPAATPGSSLRLVMLNNDTVCGVLSVSSGARYYPLSILASCASRRQLSGENIVIDSVLAWLPPTPLAEKIVEYVKKGQSFTVYAGPVNGALPFGLLPLYAIQNSADRVVYERLLDEIKTRVDAERAEIPGADFRVWQLPLEGSRIAIDVDMLTVLPLTPLYRKIVVYKLLQNPYTQSSYRSYYFITEHGEWTKYIVPVEPLPYARLVLTPLAYAYTAHTSDLPLIYLVPWRMVLYEYRSRTLSLYLPAGYTPAFITYFDISNANCTIEYTGSPVVKVIDEHSYLFELDNTVCIKAREYNASIDYVIPFASARNVWPEVGGVGVINPPVYLTVGKIYVPGDVIICIPGAKLVCSGKVYMYYSFAPSVLYNKRTIHNLNSLVAGPLQIYAFLYGQLRDTDLVYVDVNRLWELVVVRACGGGSNQHSVITNGVRYASINCNTPLPPGTTMTAAIIYDIVSRKG